MQSSIKRVVDLLAASAMLLLAGPVMLVVALLVYLRMGRPVFFRQLRAGYRGKPFVLHKFRTMREQLGPEGQPLADADRLTPLGRRLRRTSLDELPQLWNVLKGDMSFVGPRPLPVRYLPRYTPRQARRHDVPPGLTGWAQVNGRNALSWHEKLELDVWYVDHRSLALDARIILRTLWKVLRGEGIGHSGGATMPEFTGSGGDLPAADDGPPAGACVEQSGQRARTSNLADYGIRSRRTVNLLFTSVGRRVELLRSFRKAYRELGIPGRIVAIDAEPLAPALQLADVSYVVPRLDDPLYVPALTEILNREAVTVVFPLIDPDIPVLAEHRQVLESTGARLAIVPKQAVETAADKWRTYRFFRRLGLTVPRSWLPGQLDPLEAEYPLFIKPRFGSASQRTFKVEGPRQLAFFREYVPRPILQEYLPGPEITNDVVCDLDGRVVSVVSRQRIRVRDGEVSMGRTVFDRGIADACVRIARALQAVGPITVQCMMKNTAEGAAGAAFTEINARFGGGLPLGIAAGANSPLWLLAAAAKLSVEIPPLGSYRCGLCFSRFDESLFVTENERQQMESRRL